MSPPDLEVSPSGKAVAFGATIGGSIPSTPTIQGKQLTKQQEIEKLRKQVEFLSKNYVTGLYSRHVFMQELEKKFNSKIDFHLSLHDADNLHEINRISGYAAGDNLLREIAEELKTCEEPCRAFHIGGDEFFVIHKSKPSEFRCGNATSAIVGSKDFLSISEMMETLDKKVSERKLKTKRRRRDDI